MRPDPKRAYTKLHTCKVCKNKYQKGTNLNLDFISVCSVQCASELALKKLNQQKENALKKERAAWRERKKVIRNELTKGGKQAQDPLQKEINTIVRLIDEDMPCLARPNERHQYFDAGHIYSVGSYPSLRYHLWNIHKQSVKSNRDLGGEENLMKEGFLNRYGQDKFDDLEGLKQKHPTLKLTDFEYSETLKIARDLVRRLKRGEYLDRDDCQLILNIYV
jgi:hypothetical protein